MIPPFHAAVDRAISYLDREEGLLGVTDFFVSSKYDLPLRQMPWARRFFWRCAAYFFLGEGGGGSAILEARFGSGGVRLCCWRRGVFLQARRCRPALGGPDALLTDRLLRSNGP